MFVILSDASSFWLPVSCARVERCVAGWQWIVVMWFLAAVVVGVALVCDATVVATDAAVMS